MVTYWKPYNSDFHPFYYYLKDLAENKQNNKTKHFKQSKDKIAML